MYAGLSVQLEEIKSATECVLITIMQVWFLLVALAAACDYTTSPTNSSTNVFDLLSDKSGPAFVLCLSTTPQLREDSVWVMCPIALSSTSQFSEFQAGARALCLRHCG